MAINPEGFDTPARNAMALRKLADELEKRSDWQKVLVQTYYAAPSEVKDESIKKARRLSKKHKRPVAIELPDGEKIIVTADKVVEVREELA